MEKFSSIKLKSIIQLMRLRQWIKNVFVLAPLFFSGQFIYGNAIQNALMATLLFCLASSFTYIFNDLRDIEKDKLHPLKSKTRPLANNRISKIEALLIMAFLLASMTPFFVLNSRVAIIVGIYILLNIIYSCYLKHEPVFDIFTIAAGFVLRVYAGAESLTVVVSEWMFVTTLCLALYLAAVKRGKELENSGTQSRGVLEQYSPALINRYAEMSATAALIFYGLFVMSTRHELVMTVPIVLLGIFRYWYVVERLNGGESPTDVLLSDWKLIAIIFSWACACTWALWPK